MTTVSFTVGMTGEERNSSRVLRPPGGASNFTLGGGDQTDDVKSRPQREESKNRVFGAAQSSEPTQLRTASNTQSNIFGADAADNKSKNQGSKAAYNILTGQSYSQTAEENSPKQEATKTEQSVTPTVEGKSQDVRTSSRVLNPPGGRSSIQF